MNTVSGSQSQDVAQLQANNAERQAIRARLEELDQQDNEILMRMERTECKEPEYVDFTMFEGMTLFLLQALWNAPSRKLSKQEVREDVMEKDGASEVAIRLVICRAREEMEACPDCRYEIKTVWGKGYRLVCKDSFQSVSNPQKTKKKRYKK